MANITITRSELKNIITEEVRPIAEAWTKKNEERKTSVIVSEMIKNVLNEVFSDSDSGGSAKTTPVSEAKKKSEHSIKPMALNTRIWTVDGPGKTIGLDQRKASNGGPGTNNTWFN